MGDKWCSGCKFKHPTTAFGKDASRGDGLAAQCLEFRRVFSKERYVRKPKTLRGWMVPTRNGDKKQARRRVNYLVEQKRIPHPDELPCFDCADSIYLRSYRHEYDHAKGYEGVDQLYVEPVCSKCHHNREDYRRAG